MGILRQKPISFVPMSDQEAPRPPQPPQAPAPPSPPAAPGVPKPQAASPTVPLKKETVRITLRAKPGTGVPQPRKATAPVPPSAPASKVTARVPTAPAPPTRATAPVPAAPAPAAPAAPAAVSPGARTVPLARPATPAVRPAAPAAASGAAAPTKALPQATVKLQRTQPLVKKPGQPGQASMPIRKAGTSQEMDADAKDPEAGLLAISIVAFVVSLVLLGVVLLGSSHVNDGKYLDIPEMARPAWQTKNAEGQWVDQFARQQLDANPVPTR